LTVVSVISAAPSAILRTRSISRVSSGNQRLSCLPAIGFGGSRIVAQLR